MSVQLNALACKMAGKGTVSGQVLLNGCPYTDRDFRHWGVYVMQAEPMLNTATVSSLQQLSSTGLRSAPYGSPSSRLRHVPWEGSPQSSCQSLTCKPYMQVCRQHFGC